MYNNKYKLLFFKLKNLYKIFLFFLRETIYLKNFRNKFEILE